MQNIEQKTPLANNHISVDCVVIGFDGEQLKVLLIKRAGEEEGEIFHDMKSVTASIDIQNGRADAKPVYWPFAIAKL